MFKMIRRQQKNIRTVGLILLSFLVLWSSTGVAAGTGAWQIILETTISAKFRANVAGFLNDQVGIVAGYSGEVHYTNDGGKTWPQVINSSACRYGLDIVNASLAWTMGNNANVRVSSNGGQSWRAVVDAPGRGSFVSFIDDKTGWAGSRDQIWETTNGGATWETISTPQDARPFVAISLRTPTEGYILDIGGTLYITRDQGQTWSSQNVGMDKEIFSSTNVLAAPTAAIRFTDQEHGLIILCFKGEGTVALRTADGGKTWRQESVANTAGAVFLSHDGTTVTLFLMPEKITVLRYQLP
jgi:photosystem II stability/assembly factor-like uncharacterized protein